jgi:hypothetical protein
MTEFIRGDANDDGALDLADGIFLLDFLFSSGATPGCLEAGDLNDDSAIDLADPIYVLSFLFSQGPNPEPPFPNCGPDPDGDSDGMTCEVSTSCP